MDLIQKIRERAKAAKKTLVLAEGHDERVVQAAIAIKRRSWQTSYFWATRIK